MRPIRLHLDTSDYSVMYGAASGTPQARVRDELKEMAQSGRIEVGLSYHVIFELLQKAEPKYRDDRLARARLLTELCGQNAFPYPSDQGEGFQFSREGLWVPRTELEDFEVERIVQVVIEATIRDSGLSRHERRALPRRRNFVLWVRSNPARLILLPGEPWPLPFGRKFAESGDLRRYVLGEMSRGVANAKLRFYLTDPVTVYKDWFEQYGMDNPVLERRDQIASKLITMLQELQSMLDEGANIQLKIKNALASTGDNALSPAGRGAFLKLDRDLKGFRAEITSPRDLFEQVPIWKKIVGDKAAFIAAQILYALHREKRGIKRSDAIDLIHAMYLPHTDLWRGDKAFSDLLIKHKVDFSERVVPALVDLPSRIESEIARRKAGSER